MDIVRFLVFNYVLHAVTVLSSPGEGLGRSIIKRLVALFIPLLGTVRAVSAIHRFARGQDTPLQVALRAQALCMIEPKVRNFLWPLCECWPLDRVLIFAVTEYE